MPEDVGKTAIVLSLLAAAVMSAQTGPELAVLARKVAMTAIEQFKDKKLADDQLGITIARLDRAARTYETGSFHGDVTMYPASVVKMFHLAYLAELLEKKKVQLTPELQRGVTDMIVESTNDATALVVDTISGTTGGPELSPGELKKWMDKRQAINRWYAGMGYPKINVCQKTWNEGPYGRERQAYGPNFELRNSISPDACVRLISEIALDKIVTPEKCAWMRTYLSRVPLSEGGTNVQVKGFTGEVVPKRTKLFSKAGWTSTVTHDVAYIVAPDGREFAFAIFTKGQSETAGLIPFLAKEILKGIAVVP
jgi:hypothetical protein